jgi:nucleoid DNA-binding protein
MSTQTKKDLVKEVSLRTGLDLQTVRDNIQSMLDTMCEGLGRDGNIEIRNFGIFKVKSISSRMARNPKTGESIRIPARNLVHFKPGQLMKQKVNHVFAQSRPVRPQILEQPAAPAPKRDERPKRPRPVSRDKSQQNIILLPRNVND